MDFLILFWKCLCTKFFFSDDNDSSRNISASSHRVMFLHEDAECTFCLIEYSSDFVIFSKTIHWSSNFIRLFQIVLPKLTSRRSSPTRQTYAMFAKPAMPKMPMMPMRRQKIAKLCRGDFPPSYYLYVSQSIRTSCLRTYWA